MAWYKKDTFKKNEKGRWIKTDSKLEKAPHDVGRWNRSCQLERKLKSDERTYFDAETTRGGLNQKVTEIRTYYNNGKCKEVRTLVTTANKLPRK